MKTQMTGCTLAALLGLLFTQTVAAAPASENITRCAPNQQRVNDNNNLLLLGGTAKGPVNRFAVGEFGKNVDRQKRLLGEFDRCGVLSRVDMSYDKREGNTRLKMIMAAEKIDDGWLAQFDVMVFVLRDGREIPVHRKQGTTHYVTGRSGNIISANETFILQGKPGFTETINHFDSRSRLIRSVSRSSDSNSNSDVHYHWNNRNQLVSSESEHRSAHWNYDKAGRELGVEMREATPFVASSTLDECQLWDNKDNCTLSYSREMEVSAAGLFRNSLSAGSRYEYWGQSKN